QQPPPEVERQDQRPLLRPGARGRAPGPRDGPPRDGPARPPRRAAEACRGLPAQRRRPVQLPGPAPRPRRRRPSDRAGRAARPARPGGIEERRTSAADPHDDWPALSGVVSEALARLQASRAEEGRAMAAELVAMGERIVALLERIAARGPEVIASYRDRLIER